MIGSDFFVPRNRLIALLIFCGTANALAKPIVLHVQTYGISAGLMSGFGVNPVIWAAFIACQLLLWQGRTRPSSRWDLALVLAAGFGLMLPGALLTWMLMAAFCLLSLRNGRHDNLATNCGLSIALVLSLREPVTQSLLTIAGQELLSFDAVLVSSILQVLGQGGARVGNMVYGTDGHQLLILTGCATWANLSLAMLAWCCITSWRHARQNRGIQWKSAFWLCVAVFAANTTRLTLMGLGEAPYHFFHDGYGVYLFDAVLTLATLIISVRWGNRHAA